MSYPELLGVYVDLGIGISSLEWPVFMSHQRLSPLIDAFLRTLIILDWTDARLRVAAFKAEIDERASADPPALEKELPRDLFDKLRSIVASVREKARHEVAGQLVLKLEISSVTESLRALQQTVTIDQEQILLADALRCLECGAFRAAIVMGWNLTFERLRRWIFRSPRKRKAAFNAALVTKPKSKNVNHKPLQIYEDFYELSERQILDIAYEAKLFSKQKHQVLINALSDRNHFAHPSSRRATSATAAGYIENLVVNILQDDTFRIGGRKR